VLAIYPTASVLPVNQLKIYLQFSAPMSEGWAARAVVVDDATRREPLEGVFLPGTTELWDTSRSRLTLLLDPGRIKQGLRPHGELGYPLQEGRDVVVRVQARFRDADGRELQSAARRRYRVGDPVRARVDPDDWSIDPPAAESTDALEVSFDRPMDRALLERCLQVRDTDQLPLAGFVEISGGERRWRFTPARPWERGQHWLRVQARLEDLAGNSLARVFDRDLTRSDHDPLPVRWVDVPFRPRA
jgi:hypothetical protein